MYWISLIIASLFFQTLFINSIDANVLRRNRRQQQTSGTLYGNSNLAANQPAGYNYPANTNFYGTNLNNQGSKDLYGNPMVPSNTGNSLNNIGQQQQQQQQQQQLYGASGQSLSNPSFSGTGLYLPSGTNQVNTNMGMRDNNGNPIAAGSPGAALYPSSNPQMGYLGNTNQGVVNKDLYNAQPNTNNNQYGVNSNVYPNSNTYSGQQQQQQQMPNNNNNNLWPNNNNNQYNSNSGNTWNPNRDLSNNNNNNALSNPSSPYFYNNNAGHQIMTSCLIIFLSFFAITFFHI